MNLTILYIFRAIISIRKGLAEIGVIVAILLHISFVSCSTPPDSLSLKELPLKDSIRLFIGMSNIQHADIVYRQFVVESNNFRSNVWKRNNNPMGMKRSGNRPTTSNIIVKGYKYYNNWKDAVIDYKMWQDRYAKNLSRKQYLNKLNKVYCPTGDYLKHLNIYK